MPSPTAEPAAAISYERTLEGEVSPDRHEELADALKKIMELEGSLEVVGRTLTWKSNLPVTRRTVIATIRSRGGRTVVRVEEPLKGQRVTVLVLFWVSFFPIATGASLALGKALQSIPMAIMLAVLVLTISVFMPSRALAALERHKRKGLEPKLTRLADRVRLEIQASPARTRIADDQHEDALPPEEDEATSEKRERVLR